MPIWTNHVMSFNRTHTHTLTHKERINIPILGLNVNADRVGTDHLNEGHFFDTIWHLNTNSVPIEFNSTEKGVFILSTSTLSSLSSPFSFHSLPVFFSSSVALDLFPASCCVAILSSSEVFRIVSPISNGDPYKVKLKFNWSYFTSLGFRTLLQTHHVIWHARTKVYLLIRHKTGVKHSDLTIVCVCWMCDGGHAHTFENVILLKYKTKGVSARSLQKCLKSR